MAGLEHGMYFAHITEKFENPLWGARARSAGTER
jgi:hypothetical protein